MASTPAISIRGIRQTIPSGYVIGRLSAGSGEAELIPMKGFAASIGSYLAPTFSIFTSGNGIKNTNGTLSVEWNAGTVTTLGTTLSLSLGTLNAVIPAQEWTAGTVTVVGSGLAISSTTLSAQWRAGTVTAVGTGLSLISGTLAATGSKGMLPLVNGDTPGPVALADPLGQFIGVPL